MALLQVLDLDVTIGMGILGFAIDFRHSTEPIMFKQVIRPLPVAAAVGRPASCLPVG